MDRFLRISFSFFFAAFCCSFVAAQEKYEKESRIKQQDVPAAALRFVESLQPGAKVKWYMEEGLERKSIEAKYKKQKQQFSIEFDTSGNVEDVEIEVRFAALSTALQTKINSYLQQACASYKIMKVQTQYSGSAAVLFEKLTTTQQPSGLVRRYELVVKCKTGNKVELMEYLFSDEGVMLSQSTVIFKNSSHLEY